mmetsp:Transcript_48513/g.128562  ORF Transcript_48513/g.128562 Transcript_48513/m.128562 type:complete len:240 (+) Transcript_48513:809-1528(+)
MLIEEQPPVRYFGDLSLLFQTHELRLFSSKGTCGRDVRIPQFHVVSPKVHRLTEHGLGFVQQFLRSNKANQLGVLNKTFCSWNPFERGGRQVQTFESRLGLLTRILHDADQPVTERFDTSQVCLSQFYTSLLLLLALTVLIGVAKHRRERRAGGLPKSWRVRPCCDKRILGDAAATFQHNVLAPSFPSPTAHAADDKRQATSGTSCTPRTNWYAPHQSLQTSGPLSVATRRKPCPRQRT